MRENGRAGGGSYPCVLTLILHPILNKFQLNLLVIENLILTPVSNSHLLRLFAAVLYEAQVDKANE